MVSTQMKKVLVIGSSSFVGKNICQKLKNSYEIIEANSKNCDLKNIDNINSFFSKIDDLYGMIYCSAIKSDADALSSCETLKDIIDVNLYGAIHCMQQSLNKMKYGKMIILGSADGTFANYKKTMYAVSKAALHVYTKCFAVQAKKHDVDVTCLVLGTVDSYEKLDAISDFTNCYLDGKLRNLNAQLIRIDGGHHTFPL